jgi:hypothetical protein
MYYQQMLALGYRGYRVVSVCVSLALCCAVPWAELRLTRVRHALTGAMACVLDDRRVGGGSAQVHHYCAQNQESE